MSTLRSLILTPVPEAREDVRSWAQDLVAVLERNLAELSSGVSSVNSVVSSFSEQYMTFVAAEALAQGDVCYLNSSGEMAKADAWQESTSSSLVTIATEAVASGSAGRFLIKGRHVTSGMTTGAVLFVHTTAGEWSHIQPVRVGQIVRVIGYALSPTLMYFDPDKSWIEIK